MSAPTTAAGAGLTDLVAQAAGFAAPVAAALPSAPDLTDQVAAAVGRCGRSGPPIGTGLWLGELGRLGY